MTYSQRWQEELDAYFAGRLPGAMGLRSWLGPWVERQSPQGSRSTGSAPEPGSGALEAARAMTRVEEALRLLDREHVRVLAGRYTPRGPFAWGAGEREIREVAGVALALPRAVVEVLRAERSSLAEALLTRRETALREALRGGSAEAARAELELFPLRTPSEEPTPLEQLRALLDAGRQGRRILRRVATAARRALSEAESAYQEAYSTRRTRRERFRRGVSGP